WLMPPFNADGWRIDVAADLGQSPEFNHKFWREFRKAVKSAKPEAIILAEHYGDAANWLKGDEWDTIMNYDAFMEPVSYFLTGMEKHSDRFRSDLLNNAYNFANAMVQNMARLPVQTLLTAMNQLSNHDHSRFLTRTNGRCGRVAQLGSKSAEENINMHVMRLGVLIQMTWIGSPTIYYGDEAGLCGYTDPDNRRTYPWGREDINLIEYHAALIRIRKNNPVLSFGSTLFLNEDYGIITYGRFNQKEKMVIAINNTDQEHTIEIPVWRIGVEDEESVYKLYQTNLCGFGYSGEKFVVKNGVVKITLTGRNGVVLSNGH
ncbi:MAG: alpha-amylase family glycosyl hydrolase, partial [Lachnospiraceae bacterium]|nr:alpha-amylase family glycosyl hydrolase [Lachnospiraceae bacterium]